MGHATRCVPVIHALLFYEYKVLIAATPQQKIFFEKEFPTIVCIDLKGYGITYSKRRWLFPFRVMLQMPKIFSVINYEHKWLQKIIDEYKIDLVISDNRYGLYSKKIPCIFITHQLKIKSAFRWVEKLLQLNNYRHIEKFDYCWIPDTNTKNNLSGELSHPKKLPNIPVHYIDLLSRFEKNISATIKYDYCIVLSGPEPQRTILENKILKDIHQLKDKILLVRGLPANKEDLPSTENVEIKNHLPGMQLQQAFQQSEYIISRSGYTTVMEVLSLSKKSILIATPGQTEQEYLSKILLEQNLCYCISQKNFNIVTAIQQAKKFPYSTISLPVFRKENLQQLLSQIKF
ncbi:UDP-N-acetylglucosamine transferase [mine drainage metagenome]|uniref:UDP-N-acetylglucosamine transferase n=1 Tax=mine drainage metagenome TaxID=410659 RepID=A0A1J5SU29_9ZZZZ